MNKTSTETIYIDDLLSFKRTRDVHNGNTVNNVQQGGNKIIIYFIWWGLRSDFLTIELSWWLMTKLWRQFKCSGTQAVRGWKMCCMAVAS